MKLFEKGKIGSLEIKNRVVMAAMGIRGTADPPDGDWGERVRAYYEARAAGGVGLITTEMTFVTQELEPVSKQLMSFKSEKHMKSLKALADTLHSYDCKLSVQLTAGFGRVIPAPIIDEEVPPVSASENTNFYVPDYPEYNSRATIHIGTCRSPGGAWNSKSTIQTSSKCMLPNSIILCPIDAGQLDVPSIG